ncbi:MAG TPA: hypothetical protein VJ781_04955 [Pyrinomonadaceae bacterium]|nr:hypothetical protein [Pyrinomonadaceae bacterium]
MTDKEPDRKQLEKRRAEILAQLDRIQDDLRLKLDRDPEEQAIQVEHNEVYITMDRSLRRELSAIEEKLTSITD